MTGRKLAGNRIKAGLAAVLLASSLLVSGCKGLELENKTEQVRGYSRQQAMIVAANERNRYQNVYGSGIWELPAGEEGEERSFGEAMVLNVRSFLEQIKTLNMMAEERGMSVTSQERDAIRTLSETYYNGLTEADRDYIGCSLSDVQTLYTDYFLAETIGFLESLENTSSALLYCADHGEDLIDDERDRFLHASPTTTAYQIYVASLAWFSDAYRRNFPEKVAAGEHASIAAEYRLLAPMARQLAQWGLEGRIFTAVELEGESERTVDLGKWEALLQFGPGGHVSENGSRPADGKAMIVRLGDNEFLAVGTHCRFSFRPAGKDAGKAWQYLRVEEGYYEDGEFRFVRVLNGDQTDWGGPYIGDEPVLLHITLTVR